MGMDPRTGDIREYESIAAILMAGHRPLSPSEAAVLKTRSTGERPKALARMRDLHEEMPRSERRERGMRNPRRHKRLKFR